MAGLLDNFFGNSFEDPKSQAVYALAGGLLSNDWKKGVNGIMQTLAGAGEYETNKKLQQAKMQEMMMKAAAEKQKMEQDRAKNEMFMNMFAPSGQSSGQGQPSQGGLLGDTQGGDPFAGVDKRALMLDYLQNGGKNMGGWVHDRTKPDMQVTSGYAYDKNRLGAGFMPSLTTSTDGKTAMIRIGADGLPVVTAPQGAVETYGAYQGKQADFKLREVYNPKTERLELDTEGNAIRAAQAPKATAQTAPSGYNGYAGGSRESANTGAMEVMLSEINNPKTSPENRAGAQRELQRLQAQSPQLAQSGRFAAAPSAFETAKSKATETSLVEQAKADVMSTQGRMSAINSANDAISVVDKALTHPGLGTATGLSGTIDPRNYIPGTNAKDFRAVHDQLAGKAFLTAFESLKGGGAISEKEGEKAQQAIARMSLTQSEKEYKQALNDYKEVIQKGAARLKNNEPVQEKQARVIDALPPANTGNRGQRIRDTTTGKILRSNGISWVAE